jgi:CPA2 family monovalent cation:H+ antiporter-2
MNDETLLVVSIGLCLGMVLFASAVGFSAALGAFIMGSILAETVESKHIEHLVEPLKNLFGAIFFVSVGMMIAPGVIVQYAAPILILTCVVLVGRVLFATLGVLASGEGLKVAVQSGFSLAQIGEFSFIIATLGMQLGVISDFIYPIIVAVSVISTFTTPYFIKSAIPVYNFLEKRIPARWSKLITGYAQSNLKTVNRQNDWNIFLKKVLTSVVIYFALALAIFFFCNRFVTPFILDHIPAPWSSVLAALITLALMSPFMVAIAKRGNHSKEAERLWQDNHFNKGALIAITILRIVLCIALIMAVLIPLFPQATGVLLIVAAALAIVFAFAEGFGKRSLRMEEHFFENLNDKENTEDRKRAISKLAISELQAKNIHLAEIETPQNFSYAGKTLSELNFKQRTGVNVVSIIRGSQKINIPAGNVRLFPFDKLIVAGTDEELQKLTTTLEEKKHEGEVEAQHQINISQFEIEKHSQLIGVSIKDSKIREKTDCMIISIERNAELIEDFRADTLLQEGDILWLAGEKDKLNTFEENLAK